MGLKTFISSLFDSSKRVASSAADGDRGIGAAVAAKTREGSYYGSYFSPILARMRLVRSYSEFADEVLDKLSDDQVRNLIAGASPVVAKAVSDYADAVSSGFTWTADKTEPLNLETPQHQLLQTFFDSQEERGGMESFIGEVARGMYKHGGLFTELIIDRDRRTPLEIKALDPTTAAFRKRHDTVRGEYYELGQDIDPLTRRPRRNIASRNFGGAPLNFRSLEGNPTITYTPLGKDPNNPYGTPILEPAIFLASVSGGFTNSIHEALRGFVYPNKHIQVIKSLIKENSSSLSPKELTARFEKIIADVKTTARNLKPGQALVTGEDVQIGESLSGSTGRLGLGSITEVRDLIRQDLITAVQSQPILMGSNEAIAETHANLQLRLYARLIRIGQKIVQAMVQKYLNLILELNGYAPLAEFRLHYENTADYKDQSQTFMQFREGLLTASEDLMAFAMALDQIKESGYVDEATAQEMWDEGMEIRRQLNVIPSDL